MTLQSAHDDHRESTDVMTSGSPIRVSSQSIGITASPSGEFIGELVSTPFQHAREGEIGFNMPDATKADQTRAACEVATNPTRQSQADRNSGE